MKKLVVFPGDPIEAYLKKGLSYKYLGEYYNPGNFFDEVYAISVWGKEKIRKECGITYIKSDPLFFKRIVKKIKPDVIRGYGGSLCAEIVQFSRIKGIPVLESVHDDHPDTILEALRYADYIICMSEAVKKAVAQKISFDENRLIIMPNRIDVNLFKKTYDSIKFAELNKRFGNSRHILHVGRKTRQKNLETLISALRYIKNAVAVFIGQGDITKYRKLSEMEGVSDRCFFVERVERNELPIWYSWCDCFCTPSRWEGFGYVFIEAAACEAGIITSDIAPMNEYLTNGENAILIKDYENPQSVADGINRVLSGGEDIDNMKARAQHVGLKFTKEIVDIREIEIYEKAIKNGSYNKNPTFKELYSYIRHARKYYKGKL